MLKQIVLLLSFHDYCGGVAAFIVSVLTSLNIIGFNLQFVTSFQSIRRVVADLWSDKINGSSKTASVLFSSNFKINYILRERVVALYSNVVYFSKGLLVLLINKTTLSTPSDAL